MLDLRILKANKHEQDIHRNRYSGSRDTEKYRNQYIGSGHTGKGGIGGWPGQNTEGKKMPHRRI